jgi:phosphoribosylanthranilate isomerase
MQSLWERKDASDMRVKICGLSTAETMAAALDARADLVGLVFYEKSPRHVSLEQAAALAVMARGRAEIVALVVNADNEALDAINAAVAPDLFQVHGKETADRVAEIRARFGKPVMKAIAVETADDAAAALPYRGIADLILFDAKAPKGAVLPGGNGVTFDWRALEKVKTHVDWMLSGGLTAANVAEAIRLTGATAVDVSSGVESQPGQKDIGKIRRFIRAAKTA